MKEMITILEIEKESNMNVYRKITLAVLVAIAALIVIPNAHAQISQEKLTVKFSGPVEIPGQVLPGGVYIFEALENGHVARIVSADGTHVYATLFTMPDQVTDPLDEPAVILGENPNGGPQRVNAWFYPGDSVGNQFIYEKTGSGKHLASTMGSVATATGSAVTVTAKTVATATGSAASSVAAATGSAAADTAKAVGASSEFLGTYSAHVVKNSGRAIARFAKYLVS
jgi:hypothetical protein